MMNAIVIAPTPTVAMSPSTSIAYAHDVQQWIEWCTPQDIDPVWATVDDLARCMWHWADDDLGLSTLGRRKAAIADYQRRHGATHPAASHIEMRAVMTSLRLRTKPQRRKQSLRASTLSKIYEVCVAEGTPRGLRDRALFAVGWSCCLGALPLATMTVADLTNGRYRSLSPEARRMAIEWIQAAKISDGRLFRAIRLGGDIGPSLARNAVRRDVIKPRCAQVGLAASMFSGESLRAGRIAHEIARGTDMVHIMALARLRTVAAVVRYMNGGR